MATVGERIREVREAKGWTQDKLATEADISKSFLSEVEKHGKNISLDLLLKVATALGAYRARRGSRHERRRVVRPCASHGRSTCRRGTRFALSA